MRCVSKVPSTIPQRQKFLDQKREALLEQMKEVQNSIDYIDWKQDFYQDVLDGKRPYISNLIAVDKIEELTN